MILVSLYEGTLSKRKSSLSLALLLQSQFHGVGVIEHTLAKSLSRSWNLPYVVCCYLLLNRLWAWHPSNLYYRKSKVALLKSVILTDWRFILMESRYQERGPRPLPSAQWWSQRQRDPNLPFAAPALPFEGKYQETARKRHELTYCRGWCDKLTWLWFRSLMWGLPPTKGISPLPPWGTALCRSLWDRLLQKSSELLRLIWVWTCPAAGQICLFGEAWECARPGKLAICWESGWSSLLHVSQKTDCFQAPDSDCNRAEPKVSS